MLKKFLRKTSYVSRYNYGRDIVDLGEYVISYGSNCTLECEYCYLRFVKVPNKAIVYEVDLNKLTSELEVIFSNGKENVLYFNCGETTDSFLTTEHIKFAEMIVEKLLVFSRKYSKKVYIEFRTKTKNASLLNFGKGLGLVVPVYAISLLPEGIRKFVERNSLSTSERIEDLASLVESGNVVGIRVEPIIVYDGYVGGGVKLENFLSEYNKMFMELSEKLRNNYDKIHSISLSVLRFTKNQFKRLLEEKSKLIFPEMVVCPDGKYRYSRPLRVFIYSKLIDFLRKGFGDEILGKICLACEFDYIWKSCNLKIKRMIDFSDVLL